MNTRSPFQNRASLFFARAYGGLMASGGLLVSLSEASRGRWGGFWIGLCAWAFGTLIFCCTLPVVQGRIAAWKEALSLNWRALAVFYLATFSLFVALAHGFFALGPAQQFQSTQALAQRGAITRGRVVGFRQEPSNPQVVFTYKIGGQTITTTGTGVGLKIGQSVRVVYDPLNPRRATLGDPRQQARGERMMQRVMPWVFAMVFFGMLLVQGVLPRPQRRHEE